jgi:hypothetical protein
MAPVAAAADVPGGGLPTTDDPRVGLAGGLDNAETAEFGMEHLGRFRKADGSFGNQFNSDLAFTGDLVIQGTYGGLQFLDVSDPENPTVATELICPGGQGDPNVHGDLLFISVESGGFENCGLPGTGTPAFRGVRIFDIADRSDPKLVAEVNTCRGSHTHRLVEDLDDPSHVYIYNSGTAGIANTGGLNCDMTGNSTQPIFNENAARYGIEIIKVPVADPASAEVIGVARLFRDEETGAINGLQNAPLQPRHPSGGTWSPQPNTNTCHDITAYPEIGLAAGACQGNGLLIDISDPANPVRIDAVSDVNFSYWHSANFNNDGTAVMFTDEWGGGTAPRCRETDRLEWGANALYHIVDTDQGKKLEFASYFKMPAVQSTAENCVAHQANIVPVPGRDIIVQAWYQGGVSMFDWTDPANPFEIGYFDRGPAGTTGGFWSAYWYNGHVFGSEIARGTDVFRLTPTEFLTANEIAAAETVVLDEHNAMSMRRIRWTPSFEVVRAFTDQAERAGLGANHVDNVRRAVDRAERFSTGPQARAAVANLRAVANQTEQQGFGTLAGGLRDLADHLG